MCPKIVKNSESKSVMTTEIKKSQPKHFIIFEYLYVKRNNCSNIEKIAFNISVINAICTATRFVFMSGDLDAPTRFERLSISVK